MLIERVGNKNLHLTNHYYVRYDRLASFQRQYRIAAWDGDGKARHGWPSGVKLPNKEYKALQHKHPDVHGLKKNVLEDVRHKFYRKQLLNG